MNAFTSQETAKVRAGDLRYEVAQYLPAIRHALEHERAFRQEQLAELAARTLGESGRGVEHETGAAGPAHREVDVAVVIGARHALADIERALKAIRAGRYGSCEGCGETIPLAVLRAIPQSRRCMNCHPAQRRLPQR